MTLDTIALLAVAAFSAGVLNAIAALETPLDRTALFTHGTTLGLNAVLERRGAKVGIVTNEGFRDIFLIGRANVPDAHMYDFTYARPEPLVRRRCIAGVKGRLDYKGRVVDELDEDGVVAAARILHVFRGLIFGGGEVLSGINPRSIGPAGIRLGIGLKNKPRHSGTVPRPRDPKEVIGKFKPSS